VYDTLHPTLSLTNVVRFLSTRKPVRVSTLYSLNKKLSSSECGECGVGNLEKTLRKSLVTKQFVSCKHHQRIISSRCPALQLFSSPRYQYSLRILRVATLVVPPNDPLASPSAPKRAISSCLHTHWQPGRGSRDASRSGICSQALSAQRQGRNLESVLMTALLESPTLAHHSTSRSRIRRSPNLSLAARYKE
jgi:hypothetical protein